MLLAVQQAISTGNVWWADLFLLIAAIVVGVAAVIALAARSVVGGLALAGATLWLLAQFVS